MKKKYLFILSITFIFSSSLLFAQTTITESFEDGMSSGSGTQYKTPSHISGTGFWTGSDDDIDTFNSTYSGWRSYSGTTPSSNTGPSGAHHGNNYIYAETSSNADANTFILETIQFTATSISTFTFYYHMHGSHTGTLTAESSSNNGGSWTTLWSISGEQHDSSSDGWTQASVTSIPSEIDSLTEELKSIISFLKKNS